MGLFSALVAQSPSETNKRSQSLELPSVVQLYRTNPLRLESTALVPPHAFLSYSAVPVATHNGESEGSVAASKHSQSKQLLVVPELGVWNVCIPNRGSDSLLLLPESSQSQSGAPYTFCLTVDLSQPDQVEPTVSLLQDALIRFLIARPPPSPSTAASTTVEHDEAMVTTAATSLYALRSVTFGLAPEDGESASKLQGDAPDERDRQVLVALMVCARRAGAATPTPRNDEHRSKQVQALLWYHLRRYAHALNAALCLVDDDAGVELTDDPHSEQPAVAVFQLAHVWRELALGQPIRTAALELSGDAISALPSPEESAAALPLLYTPQQPHAELIESVVLRNATYPGVWDAAKDSLWKVLPAQLAESESSADGGAEAAPPPPPAPSAGDGVWLAQLRDSVAAAASATKTPSKPARKDVAPDSAQKDAAVSSFFESLLK